MKKVSNGKILMEIVQRLTKLETQISNLMEQNTKDHEEIKRSTNDMLHTHEARLKKLEEKQIELSITWKVIIGLFGSIPTILLILTRLGVI